MQLGSQFVVPGSRDKVFAMFFDPETMRVCLPGCEDLRQIDETHYAGSLVNEVAHVKFKAGFTAEIQSVSEPTTADEPAVVKALLKGEDRRLGSRIKVDATMTVAEQGEESLVTYDLELAMWGKLGRLGEPVIRRRSVEVQKQFAEALAAVCAGRPVETAAPSRRAGGRRRATEPVGATSGTAPVAGEEPPSVTTSTAALREAPAPERDVPFLVAVATAALAIGIIIGGRGKRR